MIAWPDSDALYAIELPGIPGRLYAPSWPDAAHVARQLGPDAIITGRATGRAHYIDGRAFSPADPPELTSDDPDAPSLWGQSQGALELW